MRTFLVGLSLVASSCVAPGAFESKGARASFRTCSGPCDQTAVRPDPSTERLERLSFVGGSFGAQECAKLFDDDHGSHAFFSNGTYPMSCAAWFPNRERRVITRIEVAFCRAGGGEPGDPQGVGCDPEPATGAGYVVNVGCGRDEIAEGGPDDTLPEGEHAVAALWDGTTARGDGALHEVPVQQPRVGSYVALRKAFDGDPIDGLVFTLRIWTAAPEGECTPGETCEDYDCDGVPHCATPGMGGPINCCTSTKSCGPGHCCGDDGTCAAEAVCEPGAGGSGSGGNGGGTGGGPGDGAGGGSGPQPSCGQGPFGFTCECMKSCGDDAACQICCVGLTPSFSALCAPNFADPCSFFGGEGCRAACSGLEEPRRGSCMAGCQYGRDFFCDGRRIPSPRLLCNFGTWVAGQICQPGPDPWGHCEEPCRPVPDGVCIDCCNAACGQTGGGAARCYNMCATRAPF